MTEKEKLEELFGEKEVTEDSIMSEARQIFKYQESVGNPYSMHVAFEFTTRELEKLKKHPGARRNDSVANDPSDTDILDWLDKRTKEQCISTAPYYGQVYADDPIREKAPPFITLHLNGEGFLFNEEGEASHKGFREAIKRAIKSI